MHKLISLDNLNSTTVETIGKPTYCKLTPESNDLGTTTLQLILHTLQTSRNTSELAHIKLKHICRHWQQVIEIAINDTQLQKALKMSVHTWIELTTDTKHSQGDRNKKAENLMRHIRHCISIFNLEANPQAIKVLHYILLHPIKNLHRHLMHQQISLHQTVSDFHHTLARRPNYQKIANRLFITKQSLKEPKQYLNYFLVGAVVGFVISNMIQFNLFRICTQ